MWERAKNRVLHEILCLGQTACPLRQAAPRPALERRNRTFDQEAHRFFVAPLESFEELDRVGHPNWPVRQPVLLHRRVAHGIPSCWRQQAGLALTIAGLLPADFLPHLSKREVSGNRTQPWDCAVLMTWIALPKRPPIVPRRMPSIASMRHKHCGNVAEVAKARWHIADGIGRRG